MGLFGQAASDAIKLGLEVGQTYLFHGGMIKIKHPKSLSMGAYDLTIDKFGDVQVAEEKVTASVLIQTLKELMTKLDDSVVVSGKACLIVTGVKGKQDFQSSMNDAPAEMFLLEVADASYGKSISLACFDELVEKAEALNVGDVIM